MNIIWARTVALACLLGVVAAALGWLFGSKIGFAFAIAALLLQVLFNTYHAQRLWRLLDAPVYGEVPSAIGMWGEIYYRLYRLAKRWHNQVRQVEQQHNRFIQAIQASPNGVVMLDEHNQIEWCNAISERHFGLNARRDVRQQITHLLRQPEFVHYLAMHRYDEALSMHHMGEQHNNVLSVQVFPYGDNRKLILSHDITQLERTETMRRDFVANVSHELKTPLTVLSGFLETMKELPLNEEEKARYLDIMQRQAERMKNIVDDLLTLAKLEGNTLPPVDQRLDMTRILKQLGIDATGLSNQTHDISVNCESGLAVLGAETELQSAFSNLVSNAVRYTPAKGRIKIDWRGTEDGGAIFSVTDSGLGIPAQHIPRLTERFYRIDRSRSRDTGGTGLGLAIVKHVLTRHQAHLEIKSQEGRGSTFSIIFPASRIVRDQVQADADAASSVSRD
ncbi:phosphate regulon sensor histidine kinase PhoR [Pandoraea sp.]|uniref:phosphate regulon sensor histidine kinase PhoR n=1 Tax=Pandoraea sp. TaxID=1883445 RepID=UPI001215A833|nr:phosphate regulon sensor histidine kinase PhoR [Pandoraea sp.]TAL52974.1 MAG: phosphate regulon sensor histidine kinase PhoR [Pandoraea sp.]TAM19426.1 MAG: phosphate regulon sensor histidine kinase PhoR [Pandoraea sp.]